MSGRLARHHVVIPDTQCKPGISLDYLTWAGRYIADQFGGKDVTIVHLGDHWDFPSLSSYDRGKKAMEGRRFVRDIAAGNAGFDALDAPIRKVRGWKPRKVFLFGNHEERLLRAAENNPELDGLLTLDSCDTLDWERHAFLKPVVIDGIIYSHYMANPMTGKPYGGMASTRLKQVGQSFIMGHQQTLDIATRFTVTGKQQWAIIAGAYYAHSEDYKGIQGNHHYRGIIALHDVKDGSFNPMFVDLPYLKRRYS